MLVMCLPFTYPFSPLHLPLENPSPSAIFHPPTPRDLPSVPTTYPIDPWNPYPGYQSMQNHLPWRPRFKWSCEPPDTPPPPRPKTMEVDELLETTRKFDIFASWEFLRNFEGILFKFEMQMEWTTHINSHSTFFTNGTVVWLVAVAIFGIILPAPRRAQSGYLGPWSGPRQLGWWWWWWWWW